MSLRLLFEGSRDNMLLNYLPKVQEVHPNCTLSDLKKYLLNKFVNEAHIRALSMPSNFYLAGVARYYFNGDLTENTTLNIFDENTEDKFIPDVCAKLSAVIRVLRNKYLDSEGTTWEQPEDFGTLPIGKLFRKYGKAIEKEMGIERDYEPEEEKKVSLLDSNEKLTGYTYEIIYNHSELRKYEQATSPGSWCITYETSYHYNTYTSRNRSFFVIFKQDGWENVQRPGTEPDGFPLDEYGVSLMAIQLSKTDGHVVAGTTRWNHGAGGINVPGDADQKINFDILSRLTGITEGGLKSIRDVWENNRKYLTKEESGEQETMNVSREEIKEAVRLLNYIQICINDGQNPFLKTRAFPNGMLKEPVIKDSAFNKTAQSNINDAEKIWRRCCIECTVTVGQNNFYVIVDHGKIMKTTLTLYPSDNVNGIRSFASPILPLCGSSEKYGLYDMAHHKPIVKENKCWFQDIDAKSFNNVVVAKIGTRQYVIYNIMSGNFVTKDGYDVFEYVTYRDGKMTGTKHNSRGDKGRYLIGIIDSSARNYFVIDTYDVSFVELPDEEMAPYGPGARNTKTSSFFVFKNKGYITIERRGNYVEMKGNRDGYGIRYDRDGKRTRDYALYDGDKKEFVKFDGETRFYNISFPSDGFAKINCDGGYDYGDDVYHLFYDGNNKNFVNVNGSFRLRCVNTYRNEILFFNENNDYKMFVNGSEFASGSLGTEKPMRLESLKEGAVFELRVNGGRWSTYNYCVITSDGIITDESGVPIVFEDWDILYPDGNRNELSIGRYYTNNEWICEWLYGEKTVALKRNNGNKITENFYRLVNYEM